MKIEELKNKLKSHNIPDYWYSLDDGLKPDAMILYKNYSTWEYFYMDEKGNRHNLKLFNSDELAYEYLWEQIESNMKFYKLG